MAFLADTGNPWDDKAPAVCITYAVHKSERPDEKLELFVVEKLAEIMRRAERLYRVEVDLHSEYLFTLYTYAEPLEEKEGAEDNAKPKHA